MCHECGKRCENRCQRKFDKERCCYQLKRIQKLNQLRLQIPNDPDVLGSSTNPVVLPYKNFPLQAGNEYSAAHKFEYDNKTNKYSIPSLGVTKSFCLIPTPEEAGEMNSEIIAAGFDNFGGMFRTLAQNWFPATQDDKNFYYSTNGGSLFGAIFGFGTSTIFVARRKCDAKLVWVKNSLNYRVDDPTVPNFVGQTNTISRVTLGIHGDRVYVTSLVTNIGPQLFCINKYTGDRIWSMAYYLPEQLAEERGKTFLVAPTDVPFQSIDGSPYIGQSVALGDLNVNVVKLSNDTVTSIFVGVSSFQNAINYAAFFGFSVYTDQGQMIRIDDLGNTATKVWNLMTTAPLLHPGDVISNSGPDEFNPFRPGADIVYIWRDMTEDGTFSAPGGVDAAILDYLGDNTGYIPLGYPTENNLTTPAIVNIFSTGSLTEEDIPPLYQSTAPGVGGDEVLYYYVDGVLNGPVDIDTFIVAANEIEPGTKIQLWAYITEETVNAFNESGPYPENQGIRYIAFLPNGYTIANAQEAEALNYFGNSTWGQAPTVDVSKNLIYFGTGQTHGGPVDELLTFQDARLNYLTRKQNVIDTMYRYARPDDSVPPDTPPATLEEVNAAKAEFIAEQEAINLDFNIKSPRGNMSYPDAIIGANLSTGQMVFGYRLQAWDQVTFSTDDPSLLVIEAGYLDGDVSSGIQLLQNVPVTGGGKRTIIATVAKASTIGEIDISGFDPSIPFDNTNLLATGVVPRLYYAGPDGALGGSNYGLSQDGGSKLIWNSANDAPAFGSYSLTYNTGYLQGFEFHVTRDGRVLLPLNSFVAAYDAGKKEIVWETPLGQLTHSQVQSYNGVSFVPRGDGVLFGFDTGNGKVVYKEDFKTKYGISGISPPTFDSKGKAVFICNYRLPIVGVAGTLGSTGVLLDIFPCELLTPKDSLKTLVTRKTFKSFDVVPKAPGETVANNPYNDQIVTHVWTADATLFATHQFVNIDGEPTETIQGTFKAVGFNFASAEIIFENNYSADSRLRYISLTFMTRKRYVLKFQILDVETGQYTNYEATLELVDNKPFVKLNCAAPPNSAKKLQSLSSAASQQLKPEVRVLYNKLLANNKL